MKKNLFVSVLLTCWGLALQAANVQHLEPAFWWTGMKNPELQIMVHGQNISASQVSIDYPGVTLKEVVRVENPNYLFLYLTLSDQTEPGIYPPVAQ